MPPTQRPCTEKWSGSVLIPELKLRGFPLPTPRKSPVDARAIMAAALLPKLLRIDEAAEILNLRPKTLRNLISLRQIESVRIGRNVRISSDTIAQLIEAGRTPVQIG